MAIIAFIESNTSGTGEILAQKALARGYDVAFLSSNPNRYGYVRDLLLHPVVVDTQDDAAILERLQTLDDVAAVLSSSEYYIEPAARAARALGLVGADPDAVARCRDKFRLQEILRAAGVGAPLTYRVTSETEAKAAWEASGGPMVVKPISGSGSIDVRLHTNVDTFMSQCLAMLSKTTNERGQRINPVVLAQALVEGPEYSIEMMGTPAGYQLMGITAKHLGKAPYFLEVGHDFPAPLTQPVADEIKDAVCKALDAVGLRLGPTHTELRLEGTRPVIIEINPRLAGGMIPLLIEHAKGVDALEAVLDVYLGREPVLTPTVDRAASIAFVIPPEPGRLTAIEGPPEGSDGVVDVTLKKSVGDAVVRAGDFRDRIGHVVAVGAAAAQSHQRAAAALAQTRVEVASTQGGQGKPSGDTGRLKSILHPEALTIVRKPPEPATRRQDLAGLAAVDEAHLLMLAEEGILSGEKVRAVLGEIHTLRNEGFGTLAHSVAPRGTYLLYEGVLIERTGVDLAGVAHTGRSRNDINACVAKVALRSPFDTAYSALWRLRSALLQRAAQTLDVAMPVYSQFQPGLPGTYAYYLLGVEEALSRDQEALKALRLWLNTSPLGACAGGGTPFPINPATTARLLGFTATTPSALDGVASRDVTLRLLAALSISGVTVTRLAQDFQLWSTREFGFLEMPDNLAGGSSMMPQKKNPYLLEMIKGRATRVMGQLAASTAVMAKTPFSNSVEVGTEAMPGVKQALRAFSEAAQLMALIVLGAGVNPEAMARSAREGVVCASLVTDTLVADQGEAFRAAHHKVGKAITTALEAGEDAQKAALGLVDGLADDPLEWASRYEHGGGPGRVTTKVNLGKAETRLGADGAWLRETRGAWEAADANRRQAVESFLAEEGQTP